MNAHSMPVVQVPADALDETWIGEELIVTHGPAENRCTHYGVLSDFGQCVISVDVLRSRVEVGLALFLGGDVVVLTDPERDLIVAAPTPTALDVEPDPHAGDFAGRPYDPPQTTAGPAAP